MALRKCRGHSLGYLGPSLQEPVLHLICMSAPSNLYEVSHASAGSLVLRTGICKSSPPPLHPQSWLAWCRPDDLKPAPGLWEAQLQLTWPSPQQELKPLTPPVSGWRAAARPLGRIPGVRCWRLAAVQGMDFCKAGSLLGTSVCLSVLLQMIGWSGKEQM